MGDVLNALAIHQNGQAKLQVGIRGDGFTLEKNDNVVKLRDLDGEYLDLKGKFELTDYAADSVPLMDGTAAFGSSNKYARMDHVHPSDTSRVPVYGKGINLLDNWCFVGGGSQQGGGQFPINQRGQTSYTGTGYGIDRWKLTGGAAALSILEDGIQLAPSAIYQGFAQLFENSFEFGKQYTFSVLYSDNLLSTASFIASQTSAYLLYLGDYYVEFMPVGGISITSGVDNPSPIKIKAVKLELGDTQTLAHQENGSWVLNDPPPNFQMEYIKCITSTADTSDTYANKPIPASGFAPGGFGLGTSTPTMLVYGAQVNALRKSGWYYAAISGAEAVNAGNCPLTYFGLLHLARGTKRMVQIGFSESIDMKATVIMREMTSDDEAWQPWEWVNPPLVLGTEYRTTERFMGKPVYAKLFDAGTATSGTKVFLPVSERASVVRYQGYFGKRDYLSPYNLGSDTYYAYWSQDTYVDPSDNKRKSCFVARLPSVYEGVWEHNYILAYYVYD